MLLSCSQSGGGFAKQIFIQKESQDEKDSVDAGSDRNGKLSRGGRAE
jgi:hypothetical protein